MVGVLVCMLASVLVTVKAVVVLPWTAAPPWPCRTALHWSGPGSQDSSL